MFWIVLQKRITQKTQRKVRITEPLLFSDACLLPGFTEYKGYHCPIVLSGDNISFTILFEYCSGLTVVLPNATFRFIAMESMNAPLGEE